MFSKLIPAALALALASVSLVRADCSSNGVDIVDGGSYFVNSSSTDAFTLMSQFDGCQGTANIILVAPDETSWQCTDVDASVDDAFVTSTCPLAKDEMYSGTWTIVILDNDGDEDSYTGQRTFQLTVGLPQTVTFTPTVTVPVTTTPTVTSTITSTETDLTTLVPVTTTKTTKPPGKLTYTITPSRVTTWTTLNVTRTKHSWTAVRPHVTTTTVAASCMLFPSVSSNDPPCKPVYLAIAQHVLAESTTAAVAPATSSAAPAAASSAASAAASSVAPAAAAATTVLATVRRRDRRVPAQAPRLRLLRRDIDNATVTVTDTNTADFATTTSTSTAAATTLLAYATASTTSTITPAAVTVWITATKTTITAATPTRVRTTRLYTTTTVTTTVTPHYTITKQTTSAGAAASCSSAGGVLV